MVVQNIERLFIFLNNGSSVGDMVENKPSRKEREFKQRKEYILESAEELFAEHGYENTSMAMIAEKSEFSVGSVYNLFPSKNDIYSNLLIGKLTNLYDGISLILKRDITSLEKIREVIEFNMNLIHRSEKFLIIYMNDVARYEWGLDSCIESSDKNLHLKVLDLIVKLIKEAQIDGFIRSDIDPEKTLLIFKKLTFAYLLDAVSKSDVFDVQKSVDEMYDIFLHGVGT